MQKPPKTPTSSSGSSSKRFVPPTVEEVEAYCRERGNNVNAKKFVDFYAARGWIIGKYRMKDWRAAVRTWEQNDFGRADNHGVSQHGESKTEPWDPSKRTLRPLKPADAD